MNQWRLLFLISLSVLSGLSAWYYVVHLGRMRVGETLSVRAVRALRQAVLDYNADRERFRDWLRELVRYRTVSSQLGDEAEFRACVERLRGIAQNDVGCEVVHVVERHGRRPALLAQCTFGREHALHEVLQSRSSGALPARGVLFYGHYDVQPADAREDGWTTTADAFQPAELDGRIYARGASDDKAGVVTLLTALTILRRHLSGEDEAPPLVVKLLFEGEEETGSPGFERLLEDHADFLFGMPCGNQSADACPGKVLDFIVSVDGGQVDERTGALLLGMRGAAAFQIDVHGPQNDVHSGQWGGAVANPLQGIAGLVASLHDSETGAARIAGFYNGIPYSNMSSLPPIYAAALQGAKRKLPSEKAAAQSLGLSMLGGGEHALFPSYLARLWFRPTLEIVGIGGGYVGEGIRGAIPARATAKILMRLVPGQDARGIAIALCDHVQRYAQQHLEDRGLRCRCQNLSFFAEPFVSDPESALVSLLRATLLAAYGSSVVPVYSGASIPALSLLQTHGKRYVARVTNRSTAIPIGVLAFALPSDRNHGPDENFAWARFDRAVHCYLHLLLSVLEAPRSTAPLPSAPAIVSRNI
jgi:acetylornithine deacetylase/succinyl-diaminopimelate desuccinylase-like protein